LPLSLYHAYLTLVRVNRFALTELRERSGYSKSALARQVGISVGTLADLESGRRNASPELVRKLADGLKVPLAALVCRRDDDGE
jgi:transcriptional regulator with XRE-family HTH domain